RRGRGRGGRGGRAPWIGRRSGRGREDLPARRRRLARRPWASSVRGRSRLAVTASDRRGEEREQGRGPWPIAEHAFLILPPHDPTVSLFGAPPRGERGVWPGEPVQERADRCQREIRGGREGTQAG